MWVSQCAPVGADSKWFLLKGPPGGFREQEANHRILASTGWERKSPRELK